MEHLLSAWRRLAPDFKAADLFLFLDYDGTLTPIVDDPAKAVLPPAGRKILERLAKIQTIKTALVSGRQLDDLKEKAGMPGMVLVGNHGIEVEGPKLKHVHPEAPMLSKVLENIAEKLQEALGDIAGIKVENKKFTLSVHYRRVPSKWIPRAMGILFTTIGPAIRRSQVVFTEGKKVWEVRPAIPWNKGKIVLWLLARERAHRRKPVLPIYIGDDTTDEDAFKVLKRQGVSVKVTGRPEEGSRAAYWLHSPAEVFEFLEKLSALKQAKFKKKDFASR